VVLVDTSVWIETFRRDAPVRLEDHVEFDEIVTCLPVIQEVLQGFDREDHFRRAHEAMWSLPVVESPLSPAVIDEAVDLYRRARRAGVTVRSSVDCLIAACALRHGLTVLHADRDFTNLARVATLDVREMNAPIPRSQRRK
jgi:predicted nucleic acid-binding protein